MGTTAQVSERTLSINSDSAISDFIDKLQLIRLCCKEPLSLFLTHRLCGKRHVLLDDLPHLGLNCRQILRYQCAWQLKIVIEAVLNHRSDPESGLRK
jgi:hypothetical protein